MAKLTLTVDSRVISRAKEYAKTRGVSLSEMVEAWLSALAESGPPSTRAMPILRSVRGVLKHANIDDYRKHLAAKFR